MGAHAVRECPGVTVIVSVSQACPLTLTKSQTESLMPAITQGLSPGLVPVADVKENVRPPIWLAGGPPPPGSEGNKSATCGAPGGAMITPPQAGRAHNIVSESSVQTPFLILVQPPDPTRM